MPIVEQLLQFARRHPVVSTLPFAAGGAAIGAATAQTPEERARRMQIGALIGSAGAMAVPGIRQAVERFFKRQVHALTELTPGKVKLTPELKAQLKALGPLTEKEKYFLATLPVGEQAKREALQKALQVYREGLYTLPGIAKNLRHPLTYGQKWWKHTGTGTKLMLGGLTGYSLYNVLQNKPGSASDLASNLAWAAAGMAPIGVWYPLSALAAKGGKLLDRKRLSEKAGIKPIE